MRHVGDQLHPQFLCIRCLSLRQKLEVSRNGFPGGGSTSYQGGCQTALARSASGLWGAGAVKYRLWTPTPLTVATIKREALVVDVNNVGQLLHRNVYISLLVPLGKAQILQVVFPMIKLTIEVIACIPYDPPLFYICG